MLYNTYLKIIHKLFGFFILIAYLYRKLMDMDKIEQRDHDYFAEENESVRQVFNLDEVIEFQSAHNVEVLRGEDFQYVCYIDKNAYGTSLTPIGALTFGILLYKEREVEVLG